MYCKKVTKENEMEPALLSHGICDKCMQEKFPEEEDDDVMQVKAQDVMNLQQLMQPVRDNIASMTDQARKTIALIDQIRADQSISPEDAKYLIKLRAAINRVFRTLSWDTI
jgi:hypothetical protein